MPYATNGGVRIHYELEGGGPPLVLHCGFLGSLHDWYDPGYVGGLQDDYQLILIDPRGHGASDKPHEPEAYAMERMAADVVAVLDDLRVEQATYWGYSMGGLVGFRLGAYFPDRCRALVLGGAHASTRPPERQTQLTQEAETLRTGGMAAYIAAVERQLGRQLPEPPRRRWLANDPEAMAANVLAGRDEPSVEDALANLDMPCLVYVGERESPSTYALAQRAAEALPRARFVPLAGLDHGQAGMRSDLVLPHVRAFLEEVLAAERH